MRTEGDLEDKTAANVNARRAGVGRGIARPIAAPLFVAAVALIAVAFIAAYYVLGPGRDAASKPSPSPSASVPVVVSPSPTTAPSPTAPASVTPSSTASPSAAATGRYVSILGYSLDLPAPWHRSSCMRLTQQTPDPAGEEFVPVPPRDEYATDTGSPYSTLGVMVRDNPRHLDARAFAEQDPSGIAGQRIEDATYAGRPAARKTIPGTSLGTYYVADGDRMFVVWPNLREPTTAQLAESAAIVDSFRFVTAAERQAARAALPTAGPPRTPEQVADGLASAFAARGVDALAALAAPCIFRFGEQAGGTTRPAEVYLADLRAAVAAGLTVSVQARPIAELNPGQPERYVVSTWTDASGPQERKLVLSRGDNDRWEWVGTIERYR